MKDITFKLWVSHSEIYESVSDEVHARSPNADAHIERLMALVKKFNGEKDYLTVRLNLDSFTFNIVGPQGEAL